MLHSFSKTLFDLDFRGSERLFDKVGNVVNKRNLCVTKQKVPLYY